MISYKFSKILKTSVLLFYFVSNLSFSQERTDNANDILKKASLAYQKSSYLSYNSQYIMYADYATNKIIEKYQGYIIKKDNSSYIKIKETEIITLPPYGIRIDNVNKVIAMIQSDETTLQNPLVVDRYLKEFNAKLISSKGEFFVCEITPKKDIEVNPFYKIIFQIRKTNFHVIKQILYLANQIDSKDSKGRLISNKPRIEISFSERTRNEKKESKLFRNESYISIKGNEIKPAHNYLGYTIYKS